MEQNRFFKFIWRANGLLIFLVALLTLGLILFFFMLESILPTFQKTPPPLQSSSVETIEEPNVEFGMRFDRNGQFAENYVTVEFYAQYDEKGIKSYSRKQVRNIGIHTLADGKTNWIFSNNNQHIESNKKIVKNITTSSEKKRNVTVGHFLVTATTTENDDIVRDIWVASADGLDAKKIIPNVAESPRLEIFDGNQARILLETDGVLKSVDFDIDTRTIGNSTIVNAPN